MGQNKSRIETIYHGQDEEAAIKRAKEINGECVYSMAPGKLNDAPKSDWGYWSGPVDIVRAYEKRIYPKS